MTRRPYPLTLNHIQACISALISAYMYGNVEEGEVWVYDGRENRSDGDLTGNLHSSNWFMNFEPNSPTLGKN